jgi:hypothetical protein
VEVAFQTAVAAGFGKPLRLLRLVGVGRHCASFLFFPKE